MFFCKTSPKTNSVVSEEAVGNRSKTFVHTKITNNLHSVYVPEKFISTILNS